MSEPIDEADLTQQQLELIARYEMHESLMVNAGSAADRGMQVFLDNCSLEECAFLLRYFSCKTDLMQHQREGLNHGHTRSTH